VWLTWVQAAIWYSWVSPPTALNLDDDFASIAEVGPELADSAAGI